MKKKEELDVPVTVHFRNLPQFSVTGFFDAMSGGWLFLRDTEHHRMLTIPESAILYTEYPISETEFQS